MISLDIKNDAKTSSSPLSLSTPDEKPTLSFSQLLRGASEEKDDKVIQNGSLILSLGADDKDIKKSSKAEGLLELLSNSDDLELVMEDIEELNPKLIATMTPKELKSLVLEAKNYLKEKIQSSDDYIKSQIKELPQSIKGLKEVAKKFGIEISKVSVETIQPKQARVEIESAKVSIKVKVKELETQDSDIKVSPKEKDVKAKTVILDDSAVDVDIVEKNTKTKVNLLKEVLQEKEVKVQQKDVKVQDNLAKPVAVEEKKLKQKVSMPQSVAKDQKIQVKDDVKLVHKQQKVQKVVDEKVLQIPQEVKTTPLFKAQATTEHTTTEQIVQVKATTSLHIEQKTPKDRADETLKLLLRGEKPTMTNTALTADFSVATAKVIAPSAAMSINKSFEELLRGETADQAGAETESLKVHKADSFEVKLNEAKQMVKYLSADVKTAIEDYKSPFTRVKVQLNPKTLGEVDLTVVQRGKNLHVNISSNNAAINTLVMNSQDLKVQLANNGINNATLNFSNGSQNSNSNAGQQQNPQQEQQAQEEYNYFDNEENNEEIISSLEIVVPQYG